MLGVNTRMVGFVLFFSLFFQTSIMQYITLTKKKKKCLKDKEKNRQEPEKIKNFISTIYGCKYILKNA